MKPSTTVLMVTAVLALVGFTVVPPVSAGESTDVTAPASFFALRNVEASAAQALGEADLRAIRGADIPGITVYLPGSNPDFPGAGSPPVQGQTSVTPGGVGVDTFIRTQDTVRVLLFGTGKKPVHVFHSTNVVLP